MDEHHDNYSVLLNAAGYRIGSFNIQSKRHGQSQEEHSRDFFGLIHDVIVDEQLDIFALQEVLSECEFNSIKRRLPYGWTGSYESAGKGAHSKFGFAYLWNATRFRECSKAGLPQILENYNSEIRLNRNPLFGRFTPNGLGAFREYRLLDIHLTSSDLNQKKAECQVVLGEIYRTVDTHRYGNFKPAITTIMGDYNFPPDSCDDISRKLSETGDYPSIKTAMDDMTHISRNGEDRYEYNSSLDHFSYNDSKYSGLCQRFWRIDAVSKYFQGDFEKYVKTISDHVPIVIEIL
jgi:endonuclease/exonuclease/phosphatase family metal-dependent hydrolase